MPTVRVHNFSISIDGYAAGSDQSLEHPLGVGGDRLHEWAFARVMEGGTTFHFVTDRLLATVDRAREVADGLNVLLGGGASTVREGLATGLIDRAHFAVVPTLLGRGESVFADLNLADTYRTSSLTDSGTVTHVVLTKR